MDDDLSDLRTLDAVARVAVLQAAAEWRAGARDRAADQAPSDAHAPADAAPALRVHAAELGALALRLAAGLAAPADDASAALRHFDRLLVARRLATVLRGVHGRVLSLYPATDAALAEAARTLAHDAERLASALPGAFARAAPGFVASAFGLAARASAAGNAV